MLPALLLLLFTPLSATPLYWALVLGALCHWAWSAGAEAAGEEYHRGRRILADSTEAAAHRGFRSWLWWLWRAIRGMGALRRGLAAPDGAGDVKAVGAGRRTGPLARILAAIRAAAEAALADADRRREAGETIRTATWADWRRIAAGLFGSARRWRPGQGFTPPAAAARWQAPPPMRQCKACGRMCHRDALAPGEVMINGIRRHLLMCEECRALNAPIAPEPGALDPGDGAWHLPVLDERTRRPLVAGAPGRAVFQLVVDEPDWAGAPAATETAVPAPAGTDELEPAPDRLAIEGGTVALPPASSWVPGTEMGVRARNVPAGRLAGPVLGQDTDVHHGGWLAMTEALQALNRQAQAQYEGCVAELKLLNPNTPQYRDCMAWLHKVEGMHARIGLMIARVDAKEGPAVEATENLGGPDKRNPSSYHNV